MADIQMRFHKDMLALTSPLKPVLCRQGFDTTNLALAYILEEDTLRAAYSVIAASGAQCLVADTTDFLPARLAHVNLGDKLPELASSALKMVNSFKPQHVLVEVGECDLPLDPSSKNSLLEHRGQYERAGRAFESAGAHRVNNAQKNNGNMLESATEVSDNVSFDAYFLSGFTNITKLKCALMGLAKVSDKPIFASVNMGELVKVARRCGLSKLDAAIYADVLKDAFSVMSEYGASVLGFQTSAPPDAIAGVIEKVAPSFDLPILVELEVGDDGNDTRSNVKNIAGNNIDNGVGNLNSGKNDVTSSFYGHPQQMFEAADILRRAGVQFLRACGDATPAYAGALAASCAGADVVID